MKTLLVTLDFPPLIGGVANYYFNRVNKMQSDEIVVLMNKTANQQLPIASYRLYYKNFFTKLIWPHWLPLIWRIYFLAKKEKIGRLWAGQILPVGTATAIASRFLKLPYFVTCHGNDLLRAKQQPRKYKLAKKILRQAEFIEANTKFTKNILVKDFGINKNKIKIVYPECSLSKDMADKGKVEELRKKYHLQGKKVLLAVARLVKSKGIENVLKALPKVWQEFPNLVYMVVGGGAEYSRLLAISDQVDKKKGRIIFIGSLPPDELPNYYALADVFILIPHKSSPFHQKKGQEELVDTESFGIVYLEAKEFGLPIIAGDAGGVREIAEKYDKMALVDSEDIEGISRSILNAVKDSKKD